MADFICPTPQTRSAFTQGGPAFLVWVDRIKSGAFEDTNRMFVPPEPCDLRVTAEGTAEYWADQVAHAVRPIFEPKFEGRFVVVPLPNISHVFYGRDVGCVVERIELGETVEAISATDMRSRLALK